MESSLCEDDLNDCSNFYGISLVVCKRNIIIIVDERYERTPDKLITKKLLIVDEEVCYWGSSVHSF